MDNTTTNVQGREIKFRSWDGKKYHYHNHLSGLYGVTIVSSQQFTGLRDKSGKEIYEGDIMTGRNRVLKVVKWDAKRAAFVYIEQFKPKTVKISFAQMYDKFKSFFNKDGILYNHEVVGNLYEHPHLLKSECLTVSEGLIDHGDGI